MNSFLQGRVFRQIGKVKADVTQRKIVVVSVDSPTYFNLKFLSTPTFGLRLEVGSRSRIFIISREYEVGFFNTVEVILLFFYGFH